MSRPSLMPLCLVLALAGCAGEPAPTGAAVTEPGVLEPAFAEAARAYQVPAPVLKSLAWVESRATQVQSTWGGQGLLQLSPTQLERAAQLTGLPVGRLTVDPKANVLGGAALLRELFDLTARSDASLHATEAGDWFEAVSLYPGTDSAADAADFAAQVYRALEAGFAAEGRLTQAPLATAWRTRAPAFASRTDGLGDYPASYTFAQSPNYTAGRTDYVYIVIHDMEGSYSGTKSWFLSTASQVSAHYIVRSSDGQITQMVSDADTAWHAQCYNKHAIGIEHEGYAAAPSTWYTTAMYTESAKLTRWLADTHHISIDRTHIIAHGEIPSSCNSNGHTDPGPGWDWTGYMALVLGQTPTTTTGVLTGVIYSNGNSANRVAGAQVTVNGQSVTTPADGTYTFNLTPGSYTASVSKTGFGTNSVTRTVTANATVWGSMEINTTSSTGTLTGKVYAFNAASPQDQSHALSGAQVSVGGQTLTTDASGVYTATLAPGFLTVTAQATGYPSNSVQVRVTAGQSVTANIGLGAGDQPPPVVLSQPVDGSSSDLGLVHVEGTASDDQGAVASVVVSVNGGAPQTVGVTSGAFTTDVQLQPGLNTVSASTTDSANQTTVVTASVTFHAGVRGLITDADTGAVLPGATVELYASGTTTQVAQATTTNGAYALDVTTAPARYVLVARATGYRTNSQTVSVTLDRQLEVNVLLHAGSDTGATQSLTFAEPAEGATLTTDTVTVYGAVAGFDLLAVQLEGVTAELLGEGGFMVTVPLSEGANTLTATATGLSGQTVSGTLHVVRHTPPVLVPASQLEVVHGGCSVGDGSLWWGLLALLPLRRRRR